MFKLADEVASRMHNHRTGEEIGQRCYRFSLKNMRFGQVVKAHSSRSGNLSNTGIFILPTPLTISLFDKLSDGRPVSTPYGASQVSCTFVCAFFLLFP